MSQVLGHVLHKDHLRLTQNYFAALLILSIGLAVGLDAVWPVIIPVALVGLVFIATNFNRFYYLFFFLLPFSIEVDLPGGFATDLPSEPLMLILSYCTLLILASKMGERGSKAMTHPIALLLILHIAWIALSSIYSSNILYSVKYLLAKSWYVLPFYFLPLFMDGEKSFRKLFGYLCTGLLISVIYVMLRHGQMGFSFDAINDAVRPIYRNHVNYGIMLIAVLPYYIYLNTGQEKKPGLRFLAGLLLLLAAVYLTYTRAAHIAVILAVCVYFVIRWRLARWAVLSGLVLILFLGVFLSVNNRYLEMAPDYTKAITHKKFDNLVEATYKMEDISTVERFYRWIAGVNMVKARPLTGFGPACFYSQYEPYTVSSYKTYVSDNPEKSGIHNYYLMVAVEQGLPGLLIFMLLAIVPVFYAEQAYHSLGSSDEANLVMTAVVSLVCILAVLFINDLLEADKVGPLFFLSLSIITYYARKAQIKKTNQITDVG